MKKSVFLPLLGTTLVLFSACSSKKVQHTSSLNTKGVIKEIARADLFSTANTSQNVGLAQFYAMKDGKIRMDLTINMPNRADSNVAVHFHEHGDCGNAGNNTHGHWNPTKENHGQWGIAPFHSGDIGNMLLNAKGIGKVSLITDRWSVEAHSNKSIIGRGIIVHGGTDDYKTQPTGNSGPRIGCGVIVAL